MVDDIFSHERYRQLRATGRQTFASTIRKVTEEAASAAGYSLTDLSDTAMLAPRLIAWHFARTRGHTSLADALANVQGLRMQGTDIEVLDAVDPIVATFFREHVDEHRPLLLAGDLSARLPQIDHALALIGQHAPNLHNALSGSVRALAMFTSPSVNSMAALGIHGLIFLNTCRPPTLAFFIDGLVHQGGHVVFSEVTLDRPAWFRVHPDTPLKSMIGTSDARTAYEALHGLFTEYALVGVMERVRQDAELLASDAFELDVRTAFTLRRLTADLERLQPHAEALFSQEGHELYERFREVQGVMSAARPGDDQLNFDDQPDEFDIRVHLARHSRKAGYIPHATAATQDSATS